MKANEEGQCLRPSERPIPADKSKGEGHKSVYRNLHTSTLLGVNLSCTCPVFSLNRRKSDTPDVTSGHFKAKHPFSHKIRCCSGRNNLSNTRDDRLWRPPLWHHAPNLNNSIAFSADCGNEDWIPPTIEEYLLAHYGELIMIDRSKGGRLQNDMAPPSNAMTSSEVVVLQ